VRLITWQSRGLYHAWFELSLRSSLSWRVTWDCCSIIIGLRCRSGLICWKHFVFAVSHLPLSKLAQTCPDLPTRGRVQCLTCRRSGLSLEDQDYFIPLLYSVLCVSCYWVLSASPTRHRRCILAKIPQLLFILLPKGATGTMHINMLKNWNFYF
jgi:hypothetical protein